MNNKENKIKIKELNNFKESPSSSLKRFCFFDYTKKTDKNFLSPALSLVISMGLVALIMVFSLGVTTLVIDTFRQSSNVLRQAEALYAAEGALEIAILKNKQLHDEGKAVGALFSSTSTDNNNISSLDFKNTLGFDASFRISGQPDRSLPDISKKIADSYIIPFPWTGDLPYTGFGSKHQGGCDPYKPPTLADSDMNVIVGKKSDGGEEKIDVLNHPCNWGKLAPGESVSIPLYSVHLDGSETTITEFSVKLRTPCYGEGDKVLEWCEDNTRFELNCYDRGEFKCEAINEVYDKSLKGEVVAQWQIDTLDDGQSISLTPYDIDDHYGEKYLEGDSQFYEEKINSKRNNGFIILSTNTSNAFPSCMTYTECGFTHNPNGIDISSPIGRSSVGLRELSNVNTFLQTAKKPVLKLSVIADLLGCKNNTCGPSSESVNIPYLEYQVILDGASPSNPPSGHENLITAEGRSASFSQSIQVKIPHQSSSIDYVIQQ